ncbi:MAG TPA: hypothetical protein VE870_10350 [Bacteroidales bacterium]|nr:hypothetical protein [Bacteroidales bacterium]
MENAGLRTYVPLCILKSTYVINHFRKREAGMKAEVKKKEEEYRTDEQTNVEGGRIVGRGTMEWYQLS